MLVKYPFLLEHPLFILVGSLFLALFCIIAFVLIPTALIRTAINDDLTKTKKVFWILGQLFIFPLPYIYLAVVDKNKVLKSLGVIILLLAIACLIIPDSRRLLIAAYSSKIRDSLQSSQANADDSSTAFCAACMSSDPQKSSFCLEHVTVHLSLFADDIAAHRAYCSNQPITPAIAKEQIAAWCKKVGPNYPFPEPRWKTMYAALAEKYPCPGMNTAPPAQ